MILLSLIFLFSCSKEASEDIGIDLVQPEPVAPVVKYQLSVTAAEGGTVSTSGGEFASGSPITVTATPNSGYSFVNWTGDGSSTNASFTFNILGNTNLTANFQAITYSYNLVLAAGDGGAVSSEGGEYEEGSEITFSAIPDEGFEFVEWSDGNTEIERSITLTGDTNISAIFQSSIKEMNVTLEGIGKLFFYEFQSGKNIELIIDNAENITSNYTLSLYPNVQYIIFINYQPFQNKFSFDSSLSEYYEIYNSDFDGIYGEESFVFDYDDFPENVDLKVEDVSMWLNEDVGGTLSTYNVDSIDFMSIEGRSDAVGLVNCLKRLDASNGDIIRQGCFYSDYYGLGYSWEVSQFKWWDFGLLVYSFIDKYPEKHAKFEYFEGDSFTKKSSRLYRDLSYFHQTLYDKKPLFYSSYSGDVAGRKSRIASFLGVDDSSNVKVGIGGLNNGGSYFELAEVENTQLTSSGQVTSTDRYLVQFKTFNLIPVQDVQSATLLNENYNSSSSSAFATSPIFKMHDWLQLDLLTYKYRNYNTSSSLTDFNGAERNYTFPENLGTLIKTWPGTNPSKMFAIYILGGNLASYYYLIQLTNGEVTYSKIIDKSRGSQVLKKFDIYASNDNYVIVISSDGKTMRLPIN